MWEMDKKNQFETFSSIFSCRSVNLWATTMMKMMMMNGSMCTVQSTYNVTSQANFSEILDISDIA